MHDEQAPPVTPGAQAEMTAEESLPSGAPATEFDVELPFDSGEPPGAADAGGEPAGAAADAAAEVSEASEVSEISAEPAADEPAEEAISTDDPEEAILRKLALLAEAEAIVATPDKNESGNAPDDRHLTERMRAVENVWRRVGPAGDREAELRARLQDLRQAYSAARSRRAEARAVDRARAGETKRALLVQAFALAQQVDPSIALPSAPPARAPRPTARRRPSPAMLARKLAADAAASVAPAPDATTTAEAPASEPSATEPSATAGEPAGGVAPDVAASSEGAVTSVEPDAGAAAPDAVLSHDGAADA